MTSPNPTKNATGTERTTDHQRSNGVIFADSAAGDARTEAATEVIVA